MIEAHVKES